MTAFRLFVRTGLVACLLLGLLGMTGGNVQAATSNDQNSIIQEQVESLPTDQIIIKYKSSVDIFSNPEQPAQMERLSQTVGVPLQYFREMSGDAHVLQLQEPLPLEQVRLLAQQLMNLPEVEYAEADQIMTHTLVPNDPQYTNQWHYFETWGINLPAAWDVTTGSSSIVAAVIDTGITNHADLSGRTVPGYDFISNVAMANDGNGRDNNPGDPGDWVTANECFAGSPALNSSWHGTHVAGTIGAASNNGLGVAGVNWNSKILPVRVLGKCGGSISDIADAMRWSAGLTVAGVPANANPARVLNLSLGGGGACSATYQNAINDSTAAGAVVVISAGNSNANASGFQPANCNGVITVAATNRSGSKANYSNFGATVEISAPGGQMNVSASNGVLSTLNTGTTVPASDTYAYYQGTSMAAPHISGVVSLVFSRNPSLTPSQVLSILQNTAKAFPGGGTCNTSNCGSGIVDAGAAVNAAVPTFPLTVSKTGTGTGTVTSNPAGINCGADCSENYNSGTFVTLTASAAPDSTFTGWSGGGCSGTGTCVVTMNVATSVTANFDLISTPTNLLGNPSFEVDANNDGKPDVWSTNAKFTRNNSIAAIDGTYVGRFLAADNSGVTIQQVVPNLTAGGTYNFSGQVNIPATSDAFTFKIQVKWRNSSNNVISTSVVKTYTASTSGWNEATASLVAPIGTTNALVQMVVTNLNATIYVDKFSFGGSTGPTYTLTVTKSGNGSGTVTSIPAGINCGADCSETYTSGTQVILTATADGGSTFNGWSGGGCSGTGTCTVTLTGNTTVNADFTTSPTGQPDLIIQSITPVPANPSINQAVDFSVVIKNQGQADASGFWVDLFIDTPLPTDCSGAGQVFQNIPSLAAGASQTLTLNYAGFGTAGVHTVNGTVDTNCNVGESIENNNTHVINVTVGGGTDLIFANSFEDDDCFTTQWSACVDDAGDLHFDGPPLLNGQSMKILIDDNNAIYVTSDHPNAETRYVASFYFDPNSIPMVNGDTHTIFGGYSGTSTLVLRLQFRRSSGLYQVQAAILNDGSAFTTSSWFTISDATHQIEFDWKSATAVGANNGGLTLWIDGTQRANLTGVDNDARRIDRARLGAVAAIDTGTRGTYYFDEFTSSREDGGPTPTFTLTVNKTGSGSGTVTSNPTGINCGSDCSESYPSGTDVELTAAADPGSTFTSWNGGGCSGTGACMVTMTADTTVTADFTAAPSQPDLIIQSITAAPTSPQVNQAVTFSVVVKNQGSEDASGFWVDLFIDTSPPPDCSGVGQVYQQVGSLAAGASQTLMLEYAGFSTDGIHTVNGTVDTNCDVAESNEGNNTHLISLTVGSDLIFANSFEDDDCFNTQWTECVDDAGDLHFDGPSLVGDFGMSMYNIIDDNNVLYVGYLHPTPEARYRTRFYFDPNSISMVNGDLHRIFYGYSGSGTTKVVLRVEFRRSSNVYQLRAGLLTDAATWVNSAWFTITDAPHSVEFDWRTASAAGANNGGLTLWIDGVQKYSSPPVDNDTLRITRIRLGAVNGIDTGTRGTYYFDAFESRRQNYIGP